MLEFSHEVDSCLAAADCPPDVDFVRVTLAKVELHLAELGLPTRLQSIFYDAGCRSIADVFRVAAIPKNRPNQIGPGAVAIVHQHAKQLGFADLPGVIESARAIG